MRGAWWVQLSAKRLGGRGGGRERRVGVGLLALKWIIDHSINATSIKRDIRLQSSMCTEPTQFNLNIKTLIFYVLTGDITRNVTGNISNNNYLKKMKKMMKLINFEKKCLESWIYFVLYTPDKWLKTTLKYIFPELPIVKHTGFRMEYDKQKSQIDLLLPTRASYLLKDNELLPQPEKFTSFENRIYSITIPTGHSFQIHICNRLYGR